MPKWLSDTGSVVQPEAEFDKALNESLRDPHHMMKWLTTSHALARPISDIVRRPGRELSAHLRELVALAVRHAVLLKDGGADTAPTGRNGEIQRRWEEQQDNQLINLIQRASQAKDINLKYVSAKGIDNFCPGISQPSDRYIPRYGTTLRQVERKNSAIASRWMHCTPCMLHMCPYLEQTDI